MLKCLLMNINQSFNSEKGSKDAKFGQCLYYTCRSCFVMSRTDVQNRLYTIFKLSSYTDKNTQVCSYFQWRRQNDNWGANIHICAFCLINFFLKSIVFTVCEHKYMNICPLNYRSAGASGYFATICHDKLISRCVCMACKNLWTTNFLQVVKSANDKLQQA